VTLDNIEFTGLYESSAQGPIYYQSYNQGDVVENCYLHGWSHQSGITSDTGVAVSFGNNEGYPSTNSGIHDSVIDGSDTSKDMLQAVSGAPNFMYNNVFQYVTNEFQNEVSVVYSNYFGPLVGSFAAGQHQNALQIATVDNGETYQLVFDNVITGSTCASCGGAVKLWLDQDAVPAGTVGYAFNNVIYNNSPGNLIDLGGHTAVFNGIWNFFNNTVECGTDSSPGSGAGGCANDFGGAAGMTFQFNHGNNHIITNASTPFSCTYGTCATILGPDLVQSVSAATAKGFTSTSMYAFQTTSANGGTAGAGTNAQAECTAINEIGNIYATAAYNACLYDTGYSCTYNTSNHTISCPNRSENTRPPINAWDIGAYQYSQGPPPPSGVQFTVTP
jgi:hypothetical protein